MRRVMSVKCARCGRFVGYDETTEGGGASVHFEPDSHFGPEICEWTCATCVRAEREQRINLKRGAA